jgi:hypothetical protein
MNNLPHLVRDKRGMRFHRLTVKDFVKVENRRSYWLCDCDCGNTTVVMGVNLRAKHGTKSCGCAAREAITKTGRLRPSGSLAPAGPNYNRLWKIRKCMITRCYNDKANFYKDYGGRGIAICDEWLNSFDSFYFWAIASGYSPGLSIDRKNNDKEYSPDNCRWSTAKQQANNKRTTAWFTAYGEQKSLALWAEDSRCKVCIPTIKSRLLKGWSFEDAISKKPTPLGERRWKRKSND